jgi:tRNA dimethylallyltransferase
VIDPLLAARLHPHDKRRIIRGLEVFKLTGQRLSHLQTQFEEGRPAHEVKVFVLDWPREQLHRRIEARVRQMFAAGLVEEVRGLVARYGSLSRTAMQAVGYREVLRYLGYDTEGITSGQLVDHLGGQPGWGKPQPGRARHAGDEPAEELEDTLQDVRSIDQHGSRSAGERTPRFVTPPAAAQAAESLEACIQQVIVRTRRFARRQETWFRALCECTRVPWRAGMTAEAMAQAILQLASHRLRASNDKSHPAG